MNDKDWQPNETQEFQIRRALELDKAGWTLAQIAEALGVSEIIVLGLLAVGKGKDDR